MWMGVNADNSIAWIEENKVHNFVGDIVEAPANARVGMTYQNGMAFRCADLCAADLSKKRKFEQLSGVVVNGVEMQTDEKSLAVMDQYATESMMNGLAVVHWKKADGTFHDWPIADFKKLFGEISKYVNDCFGRQKMLLDEINAAEDPGLVDISQGWPSKTITFV